VIAVRLDFLAIKHLFACVLSLICLAKNNASARPASRSHVVSRASARDCIASLNVGQSLISPEKWSGLYLSSLPLPGAMLTRRAAAELGNRAL
jgi:hypothetical protein